MLFCLQQQKRCSLAYINNRNSVARSETSKFTNNQGPYSGAWNNNGLRSEPSNEFHRYSRDLCEHLRSKIFTPNRQVHVGTEIGRTKKRRRLVFERSKFSGNDLIAMQVYKTQDPHFGEWNKVRLQRSPVMRPICLAGT
jgi:hypothetical protein